jgi:CubicO group peptidase (beta-lactamase class C family)
MKDYLGDPAFPDDVFAESSPATEGMDEARLLAGAAEIESKRLPVHALLVIRHGRRVFERQGVDGGRQLTPSDLHLLASTTKTFAATLIGIAIAEGLIASVQSKVLDFFDPAEIANPSPAKDRMTLDDVLTMRSGIEFHEGVDDEYKLFADPCSARLFLSRPLVGEPGVTWNYSSANSQVLVEIVRRVTGKKPLEYAREKLFDPLGITAVEWAEDGGGTNLGGFDLSLRPRDLARFGWMLLNGGRWKGMQLVPEEWLQVATRQHTVSTSSFTPNDGYGYQCWIPRFGGFATRGFRAQNMYMLPDRDLLVVINAALASTTADEVADDLVERFVLGAVRS